MAWKAAILSVDPSGPIRTGVDSGEYRRHQEEKLPQIEGIEKLGPNAWLIPLPHGLPFLAKIASVADFVGYPYRVLPIEHDVAWVKYGEWK